MEGDEVAYVEQWLMQWSKSPLQSATDLVLIFHTDLLKEPVAPTFQAKGQGLGLQHRG